MKEEKATADNHRRPAWDVASIAGLIAFAAVLTYAGFTMLSATDPALTDARADWITANAAAEGLNPWADLRELAGELGTEYLPVGFEELGEFKRVHPRTPGGLLLMWPLTLFGADSSYPVMIVLASLAGLATVGLLSRMAGTTTRFVMLGATLAVGSAAYTATLEFGTQSTVLLLLVAATWHYTSNRDSSLGGVALGVAMTLRLFPGLLVIPLWAFGRKKAAASSIFTFLALNATGLVVFRLTLTNAIDALQTALQGWASFGGNGSLVMPLVRLGLETQVASNLVVGLGVVTALFISHNGKAYLESLALTLVIALMVSPLSWEHYDVLGLLVFTYLAIRWAESAHRDPILTLTLASWALLQMTASSIDGAVGRDLYLSGSLALAGRGVLLAASLSVFNRDRDTTTPSRQTF